MTKESENSFSKSFSLVMSSVLIAIHTLIPYEIRLRMALTESSSQISRITYMIVHANSIHLFINLYAVLTMVFLSNARLWQIAASIVIAASLPNAIIGSTPMLGLSVVSYALTGMLIMNSRKVWLLLLVNMLILSPQFFFQSIAAVAHVYGFLVGISVGLFYQITFKPRYE